MSNPLQSIPPRVRQALYVVYALAGVLLTILPIYDVDTSREMQVYGIIGAAFGLTAASNTPSFKDVVEGDAPVPDDRGDAGLLTIVVVILLVLLVVGVFR